ncbi:tyrosinase family protein [Aliikangiella sp. G2MR2-5]|uniref:tyrosinase family protein n=1 Tax=Aliikangiella sp. G2MR2-5 TaxID=2788943 RepID=UPI0018A9E5A2|nr:tyrosinase family protein [Aliikangiella sp. G2MR2-5]
MKKTEKSSSAYDRVKQILNDIQGDRVPDYQGYKAFWLAIETFETVELYGQRMISPPISGDNTDNNLPKKKSCCGGSSGEEPNEGEDRSAIAEDDAVQAVNTEPSGHADPDCWPSGGSTGGGAGGGEKRSDRSGIIKGLKGEYPFDGSIFPPLLWDAKRRATASEIQFIAQWIDDGCPTESESINTESEKSLSAKNISVERNELVALACGEKAHKVSNKCSNVNRKANKGLNVRKEVSTLTDTEVQRLRNALSCMYQYNDHWMDERSFDYWARIHTNSCQHGWEQFLPWHRLYLYFFEQTLQDYDEYITLPYWSWADYADANTRTFNTNKLDQGVIPEAYRCWLTQKAYNRLEASNLFSEKELAGLQALAKSGATFNSGLRFLKAACIPYQLIKNPDTGKAAWSDKTRLIYNELRLINPLWFPNRWPGAMVSPMHYPTKANINQLLSIKNWSDFAGGPENDHHFGKLEEVHNGMHNFSGGQNPHYPPPKSLKILDPDIQNTENPPYGWMTDNRITAYDPIFWAHHSNVDRIWARWQELHPDVKPEDMDGVLPPWSLSIKDTLSVKKLGYEYMRDSYHYEASSSVSFSKFNSEKAGVKGDVLDTYRKADIRLHRVQLGNMFNTTIRMFLNAPDASADTPIVDNEHFVGEITTFHGTCYGGPGHCNLPLDKTRQFDRRSLHHHEPRNYRVDASDAVRRMLAKGEEDISVHLVAVGLDGKPIDNALFFDGVSLNFMD